MSVFKDITFEFGGETYTVKANNVFRLIAQIEEVVTVAELFSTAPKMTKIAEAYATCLNYCGTNVQPEEVYQVMFSNGGQNITGYIQGLVAMVVPPEELRSGGEKKTVTKA